MGRRDRRLSFSLFICGGSASFQKLSACFALLGSWGAKEAPAEALHPQEGAEAKWSGIKIVWISLTAVCLRQTPWEGRRPSFNSLTSNSGCLCWFISLNPLWNPAFIPQYPVASPALQLINHPQPCGGPRHSILLYEEQTLAMAPPGFPMKPLCPSVSSPPNVKKSLSQSRKW